MSKPDQTGIFQPLRTFYDDRIAPVVGSINQAIEPVVSKIKAVANWLGRRIEEFEDTSEKWILANWGQTAAKVARKAFEVLPEIVAMLGLFIGLTAIPMAIFATRAVSCCSIALRDVWNNDMPAAREHILEALKTITSRLIKGAVVTSFVIAGKFGLFGVLTFSLSRLAKAGIYLGLAYAGRKYLMPEEPPEPKTPQALSLATPVTLEQPPSVPPCGAPVLQPPCGSPYAQPQTQVLQQTQATLSSLPGRLAPFAFPFAACQSPAQQNTLAPSFAFPQTPALPPPPQWYQGQGLYPSAPPAYQQGQGVNPYNHGQAYSSPAN